MKSNVSEKITIIEIVDDVRSHSESEFYKDIVSFPR